MRLLCLMLSALALASCAPQPTWQNSSLYPGVADRQREIDSAECTVVAMQSVPLPPSSQAAAPPAPSEYRVRGSVMVYGANGDVQTGSYNGTVSAKRSGSSYAEALEQGQRASQTAVDNSRRNQAYKARDNFADACMLRRGWVKRAAE